MEGWARDQKAGWVRVAVLESVKAMMATSAAADFILVSGLAEPATS